MDGMLSQDEINALLNGIDTGTIDINDLQADTASTPTDQNGSFEPAAAVNDETAMITEVERDAIGEIANISMGSAATTLYSLVNRKVNIRTPVVTLANWSNVIEEYEKKKFRIHFEAETLCRSGTCCGLCIFSGDSTCVCDRAGESADQQ